jgi:hypothetical protein
VYPVAGVKRIAASKRVEMGKTLFMMNPPIPRCTNDRASNILPFEKN